MQTTDITATDVAKSMGSWRQDRSMGPTLAQSDGVVGHNRIKWIDVFANQRRHDLLAATHRLDHVRKAFMRAAPSKVYQLVESGPRRPARTKAGGCPPISGDRLTRHAGVKLAADLVAPTPAIYRARQILGPIFYFSPETFSTLRDRECRNHRDNL